MHSTRTRRHHAKTPLALEPYHSESGGYSSTRHSPSGKRPLPQCPTANKECPTLKWARAENKQSFDISFTSLVLWPCSVGYSLFDIGYSSKEGPSLVTFRNCRALRTQPVSLLHDPSALGGFASPYTGAIASQATTDTRSVGSFSAGDSLISGLAACRTLINRRQLQDIPSKLMTPRIDESYRLLIRERKQGKWGQPSI